jgi:hypothetical protein
VLSVGVRAVSPLTLPPPLAGQVKSGLLLRQYPGGAMDEEPDSNLKRARTECAAIHRSCSGAYCPSESAVEQWSLGLPAAHRCGRPRRLWLAAGPLCCVTQQSEPVSSRIFERAHPDLSDVSSEVRAYYKLSCGSHGPRLRPSNHPDRTGPDRTGPDRTGPGHWHREKMVEVTAKLISQCPSR